MLGEGAAQEEKEDVDPAEDGKMSTPAGGGAGIEMKDGEVQDGIEKVSWQWNSRKKRWDLKIRPLSHSSTRLRPRVTQSDRPLKACARR